MKPISGGEGVSDATQYILVSPAQMRKAPGGIWSMIKAGVFVGVLGFMLFSGFLVYRWMDENLLHWGIDTTSVSETNTTDLVMKLQAFEVVTIKHQYAASTEIDVNKGLAAGPLRTSVPGWLAGQEMKVDGQVLVAAGVDLSQLRPEDIIVTESELGTEVLVRVPAPFVTSTEIVPGSLDMDTSKGLITKVRTNVGLSERDLRDEAGDAIAQAARNRAVTDGLLIEAAFETKRRLESFLNGLPQSSGQKTFYRVEVAPQSLAVAVPVKLLRARPRRCARARGRAARRQRRGWRRCR